MNKTLYCLFVFNLFFLGTADATHDVTSTELELAIFLYESGDPISSTLILNEIIVKKEAMQSFDNVYFQAVSGALGYYSQISSEKTLTYLKKLDHCNISKFPNVRFEGDKITMINLPPEMTDPENKKWINELFQQFGMELSENGSSGK